MSDNKQYLNERREIKTQDKRVRWIGTRAFASSDCLLIELKYFLMLYNREVRTLFACEQAEVT